MNLMESMPQIAQEIAHLHVEIQNTKEALQTAKQDVDFLTEFSNRTNDINKILVSQLQETNEHGHGLTNALEPVENTHPTIVCRSCFSRGACMLILPCHHLTTCKSCGVHLTMCPICGTAIAEAIECRFV
ncbi:hypothetical protein HU200_040999 [Digitaria exilis]|uniref:RING-type domain-containing protein n=1 Tax=Digitaria exilis TaxID=1010633 RepID=A0A835B7V3_9POAL|nr:hypothetical protein HU200_040999 [Digitaria exilis]